MHRDPRAGLTCVCYPACVPTPAAGLFSGLKTQKVGSEGTRTLLGVPTSFLTDVALEKAGFLVAESTWVCCGSAGSRSRGETKAAPSSRTNILTPSGQKVASLRCESWVRLGPRRSPSLLRPFASLFPRIPGYAAAHRTPTHSLCSLDCRDCGCSACSAIQPASSWLPLLALGSAPGVFPRRSSAGLPSLRCLPTPCRAVGGQPGS